MIRAIEEFDHEVPYLVSMQAWAPPNESGQRGVKKGCQGLDRLEVSVRKVVWKLVSDYVVEGPPKRKHGQTKSSDGCMIKEKVRSARWKKEE